MRCMWCTDTWKNWTTLQMLVVVMFLCSSNNLQHLKLVFSIRLSHRHLKLDMSNLGIIVPFPAPRPTSLAGSPAQLNVFLTHPGVQARNLASCRCPPSPVSCPSDQSFSKSHGFRLLWLSPPLISSSSTANMSSEPYLLPVLLWLLFTPTLLFLQTPTWKKTFQKCKTIHIGWYVSKRDSVDSFFFVSMSGGKGKQSSEKTSLRVSQRVPVQLHTSCSEKRETERPKAAVLVLHGRPTQVCFSAPLFFPRRGCTVPGGTEISGQSWEWMEQSPIPTHCSKNPFNILSSDRGRIRY